MSAADFGAPTNRERIFVIGFDNHLSAAKFDFPTPTHSSGASKPDLLSQMQGTKSVVKVRDALGDLPDVGTEEADALLNHSARAHRPETIEHFRTIPQGVATSRSFRYRAPWDGPCRSLTAGTDNNTKSYIHPIYDREMSVREYARIHGFPDSWDFKGTRSNGLKGIANAVPVQLGTPVVGSVTEVLLGDISTGRPKDSLTHNSRIQKDAAPSSTKANRASLISDNS